MRKRILMGAILAGVAAGHGLAADNSPQVSIIRPLSNQTVSGHVTIYVQATDDVGVTELRFFKDYFMMFHKITNPAPVANKVYSATLDTTGMAPGLHEINVKAYDTPGDYGHYGFYTLMVNVGAATTGCQDLRVVIQNTTSKSVGGGVWGLDGQAGGAGWLVNPHSMIFRDLPVSPRAEPYLIYAEMSTYGNMPVHLSCQTPVPTTNGCPKLGANAILSFSDSNDSLTCTMRSL